MSAAWPTALIIAYASGFGLLHLSGGFRRMIWWLRIRDRNVDIRRILVGISDYIQHPRSRYRAGYAAGADFKGAVYVWLTLGNFQHVIECRLIKRRSSCRQGGGSGREYRCSAVSI